MQDKKTRNGGEVKLDRNPDRIVAHFQGPLDRFSVPRLFPVLEPVTRAGAPVVLDMAAVSRMDSAGVALVADIMKKLGAGPKGCSIRAVEGGVARRLDLAGWDFHGEGQAPSGREAGRFEAVGEATLTGARNVTYFLYLLSEICFQAVVAPFRGSRLRYRIILDQMAKLGAGSAPIVWLVAILVGLTTAFQSAYELRQFGANIYVADLVSISMLRELGPLMAAILVAGRSGSAITAEIGTMRVNEEIDALTLMGINPIQYLAVPRVIAVMITQALLGATAAVVGILGGVIIAVVYLNLSISAFFNEAVSALTLGDLGHNLIKSTVFGVIIVVTGVVYGLRVKGGAEGVGGATTQSVVTAIFLIIAADCAFSFS